MAELKSVVSFLWTPSRRRVSLSLDGSAEAALRSLEDELNSSDEVSGRVAGRALQIRRQPTKSAVKGIFSTYFYAVVREDGENCRIVGHFQWHPVGRMYAAAWMVLSALIPLAFLGVGALRGSPESTARDALPYLVPVLLPLLLIVLLYVQRRRDLPDEQAIRRWLAGLKVGWQEVESESIASPNQESSG